MLDWTINVGNLTAGIVAGAGFFFGAARLYSRLESVESAVKAHARSQDRLDATVAELVTNVAGIMGALNPSAWLRPETPHRYRPEDPHRLP